MGLHNRGFRNIDLLLTPFNKRPERSVLFKHRPPQFEGASPRSLAQYNGGRIINYSDWQNIIDDYDWFVVCGANLIEKDFANSGKILNVHAGLIPAARGLDSFKWSILNNIPLGNTLHKIDEDADAGEVLCHLITPIFQEDTLSTLANRHYENEIWMLINFDILIKRNNVMKFTENPAKMRMPASTESKMIELFDKFKDNYRK